MKKALVISSFLLLNLVSKAQNPANSSTWLEDSNGKIISSNNYTDVDGNPYFPKQWIEGSITLKTGKNIAYSELRYNIITGNLEFNYVGKAYDVTNLIDKFTLGTMKFRNSFPSTEKQNTESYYQVLYDGKQNYCVIELPIFILTNLVIQPQKPRN
jgi:hypothetical protein